MQARTERIRTFMRDQELDAIIINKPENRLYFSRFSGTAGILIITGNANKLLTDFRYVEQAAQQADEFEIVQYEKSPLGLLGDILYELQALKVGFESDYVCWDTYQEIAQSFPAGQLIPVKIDQLRAIKDIEELSALKRAVAIADEAFGHILSFLRPGVKEKDIALELEYKMRKLGAEKSAFEIIVASGIRGALPHGVASDKLLENGDMVTMDFGAVYQGYHSDLTRTVVLGKAKPRQREIYEIVSSAQLAGISAIRSGEICKNVDDVARTIIAEAGYGKYFGHGLGHGVGLMIHEEPRLSPYNSTGILKQGMAVTVEPGIYIPGWGGIRIEDVVIVNSAGCDILTASSKQFIEL